MDKPMSEYAADAPRVLRDFLTYISTIQGKSAKVDCRKDVYQSGVEKIRRR